MVFTSPVTELHPEILKAAGKNAVVMLPKRTKKENNNFVYKKKKNYESNSFGANICVTHLVYTP